MSTEQYSAAQPHPGSAQQENAQHGTARPVRTVAAARSVPAAAARPAMSPPPARTAPVPVPMGIPEYPAATAQTALRRSASPPEPEAPVELPVLRIVAWQLVLVLAFLAIGRSWPVATALGVAAAALLALTAIRIRGRWTSTLLGRWLRLRLPGRRRDLPDNSEAAVGLLEMFAPGAGVATAELAGTTAGVLSRREELLAILRPLRSSAADFARAVLADPLPPEPDPSPPALRLRIVLHRGPQGPALRAWLAVGALRDLDAADDEELRVALSNTVRRIQRRLHRGGLEVATLAETELLATLTALSHAGPGRGAIREDWRHWCAGPVAQVGLRLSGAGRGRDPLRLLESLFAAVPAVACTAAFDAGDPSSGAVLRLASTTATAVDAAAEQLRCLGPVLNVQLDRLDGLHGPAAAATLPIGGSPL